jgi:hypothetical protein
LPPPPALSASLLNEVFVPVPIPVPELAVNGLAAEESPAPPVPERERDPELPADDGEFALADSLSMPEVRDEPDPGAS